MLQNIHSNAFNFGSSISSGVDARTGQYGPSITMCTLKPYNSEGHERPINISYSALNSNNEGFGNGWSMNRTQLNLLNGILRTADGISYSFGVDAPVGQDINFRDQKIRNLRVRRVSDLEYDVISKEGTIERLRRDAFGNIARAIRLTHDNGEVFDFNYDTHNRLISIVHRATGIEQLTLQYSDISSNCIRYTYPSDGGVRATVQLEYRDGGQLLSFVKLPFDASQNMPQNLPQYEIQYQLLSTGYRVIDFFRTPIGAVERIMYNTLGHRVTHSEWLPSVAQYEVFPGSDQPSIVTRYEYGTHNFMGYSSSHVNFEQNIDNLYRQLGEYNYFSREILMRGTTTIFAVEREYNRFHLLFRETTFRDVTRKTKTITYNEHPYHNFENQPANLQLPRQSVIRYQDHHASGLFREETETIETDAFGNVLSNQDASGITQTFSFFPAEGAAGCPRDPLGFSRFLREIRVSPAFGNLAPRVSTFTYQLRPGTNHVVRITESHNGALTRYTHINNDPINAGRIASAVYTFNGRVTTRNYQYQHSNGLITKTRTTRGFDGATSSHTSVNSLFTGKELESTDTAGVRKSSEYNLWGQLTRETIHSQQGDVNTLYAYTIPGRDVTIPFTETVTDASGVQTRTTYDGLGRQILIERQDDDGSFQPNGNYTGTFRILERKQYNRVGELIWRDDFDYYWDGATNQRRQTTTERTSYTYDAWGEPSTTTFASGFVTTQINIKVRNVIITQIFGARHEVQFNNFGQEESKTTSVGGIIHSRTQASYNGFGQIISETDANGHTTHFGYDNFGRLTSETASSTGVRTDYTYADFSHEEYIESISVNTNITGRTELGRLQYDGLGRITLESTGGRVAQYRYNTGLSKPSSIDPGAGLSSQDLQHIPMLGDAPQEVQFMGSVSNINYNYNLRTGAMTSVRENNNIREYDYYPSGLPQQERLVTPENRNASFRYSMRGRPQQVTDLFGNAEEKQYDNIGRLLRIVKGTITTNYEYRPNTSLPSRIRVVEMNNFLETTIEYDDLLRENGRSFSRNGVRTDMQLEYTAANQIRRKTLRSANSTILSDETYEYNADSRLSIYRFVGGTQGAPIDHTGQQLFTQRFTYDQFGNISALRNHYSRHHDDITYGFNPQDPTQLISITTNGGTPVILEYDQGGRLTRDEQGRTLRYEFTFGRLISVSDSAGALLCTYEYDVQGNLTRQILPNGATNNRFYALNQLSNLQNENDVIAYTEGDQILAQMSTNSGNTMFSVDYQGSIIAGHTGNESVQFRYTPYGFRSETSALPGYTGEIIDPITGWYFLGNGYRVYNPVLMRFHSPDSLSPFGEGGLNPYTYCDGDPINYSDPTGHMSAANIILLSVTVLSMALTATGVLAGFGAVLQGLAAVARFLRIGARAARTVNHFTHTNRVYRTVNRATNVYGRGTLGSRTRDGVSLVGDAFSIGSIVADENDQDDLSSAWGYLGGSLSIISGFSTGFRTVRRARNVFRRGSAADRIDIAGSIATEVLGAAAFVSYAYSNESPEGEVKEVSNWVSIGLASGGLIIGLMGTMVAFGAANPISTLSDEERALQLDTMRRRNRVVFSRYSMRR